MQRNDRPKRTARKLKTIQKPLEYMPRTVKIDDRHIGHRHVDHGHMGHTHVHPQFASLQEEYDFFDPIAEHYEYEHEYKRPLKFQSELRPIIATKNRRRSFDAGTMSNFLTGAKSKALTLYQELHARELEPNPLELSKLAGLPLSEYENKFSYGTSPRQVLQNITEEQAKRWLAQKGVQFVKSRGVRRYF